MARSPSRTPEEDALLEKAARLLPGGILGGYSAPPELAFVVREAAGARIRDVSGREYIDYLLGSGPLVLGHAHPAVVAAVEAISLAHGEAEISRTIEVFDEALRAITGRHPNRST